MEEARKHIKHMTQKEIGTLRRIMQKQNYNFTTYSMTRAITRGITNYEVMKAINEGEIIEFHLANGSPRVLLRHTIGKRKQDTCVVVDLIHEIITTSYKKHTNDHRIKISKELYSKDLNILEILSRTMGV